MIPNAIPYQFYSMFDDELVPRLSKRSSIHITKVVTTLRSRLHHGAVRGQGYGFVPIRGTILRVSRFKSCCTCQFFHASNAKPHLHNNEMHQLGPDDSRKGAYHYPLGQWSSRMLW